MSTVQIPRLFQILVSKPQTKHQIHAGSVFDIGFARWLSITTGNTIGDLFFIVKCGPENSFQFCRHIPCKTTIYQHEIHYSMTAFLLPFLETTFLHKRSSYFFLSKSMRSTYSIYLLYAWSVLGQVKEIILLLHCCIVVLLLPNSNHTNLLFFHCPKRSPLMGS